MDYKLAEVATQWWIDQITKHCMESYPSKVIRKNSELFIVDEALQNELSRFEKILFKEILYHLSFKTHLSLTCYYWPSGDLGKISRKSCISSNYFPHQANMQIYDGYIEVSLGGADLRKLPLPTKQL